ncbi:hypothetical protein EYF80_013209 [Liparis tanakae]|uniref:Uncharacterized protein n=1 Tax=Liparis tanakae TaxID=230148 RepID=A0A4Z2IEL8_9TELE|nr:hypothetical protein EYF80_013209 [Liparis tanakae]
MGKRYLGNHEVGMGSHELQGRRASQHEETEELRKLRGAAERLQLQEHFGPGGVGDATHSRCTGAGSGALQRTGPARGGRARLTAARFCSSNDGAERTYLSQLLPAPSGPVSSANLTLPISSTTC